MKDQRKADEEAALKAMDESAYGRFTNLEEPHEQWSMAFLAGIAHARTPQESALGDVEIAAETLKRAYGDKLASMQETLAEEYRNLLADKETQLQDTQARLDIADSTIDRMKLSIKVLTVTDDERIELAELREHLGAALTALEKIRDHFIPFDKAPCMATQNHYLKDIASDALAKMREKDGG